jgi:hypothetical protein
MLKYLNLHPHFRQRSKSPYVVVSETVSMMTRFGHDVLKSRTEKIVRQDFVLPLLAIEKRSRNLLNRRISYDAENKRHLTMFHN